MEWLNHNAGAIQTIAVAATLILTLVLVATTIRYTQVTREALRLAQRQFDREWKPDLRMAAINKIDPINAQLEVANMSKATAFVSAMRIGTGRGQQQDIETFPASLLVRGGDVGTLLVTEELSLYRRKKGPKPFIEDSTWECICGISLIYDCAGQTINSPWFNFVVNFHELQVVSVSPYPYGP